MPYLERCLWDPNPLVRIDAAEWAAIVLSDGHAGLVAACALRWHRRGPLPEELLESILGIAVAPADLCGDVCGRDWSCYWELRERRPALMAELAACLPPGPRRKLALCMAHSAPAAPPALIEDLLDWLCSKTPGLRSAAVATVGAFLLESPESALPFLSRYAGDEDPETREIAGRALGGEGVLTTGKIAAAEDVEAFVVLGDRRLWPVLARAYFTRIDAEMLSLESMLRTGESPGSAHELQASLEAWRDSRDPALREFAGLARGYARLHEEGSSR